MFLPLNKSESLRSSPHLGELLHIKEIQKLPAICVKGLMAIAPYVENPEDNRQYFVKMKNLSVDITNNSGNNIDVRVLSMGMTGDYQVAIEEGASYIRVGTGIFGTREYK